MPELLTDTEILNAFGTIALFGIGAQWIGSFFGFPSLLLLLPAGLLAGDILGLVDPELLLGDTLFPLVTLLVSLLLYHSGLQLRIADLPGRARVPVYRLISIGLIVAFVGGSMTALVVLDIPTDLAFLLGAITVVSGPTVVGPLLATLRPRSPLGSILSFEGTFLDPIGATLGVVVLNIVLASGRGGTHPLAQGLGRLGVGVAFGALAAAIVVFALSRFWVPDNLEAAVAAMFAVIAFTASEALLSEAGLFATLTFGVLLGNQRIVSIERIRLFGETLEVLIIGVLFILLGALVTVDGLREYGWSIAAIVAILILIVRPLTVAIALVRTDLGWRDRALVGWVAPRGIVAASTAATFAGSLTLAEIESDFLLPVVFGVILGTGIIYGLTARPVAGLLGVRQPPSLGVGLIGDSEWVLALARTLRDADVDVMVGVSEPPDAIAADTRNAGVTIVSVHEHGTLLGRALHEADVAQVAVCTAPGLDIGELALIEHFGRRNVLRLPSTRASADLDRRLPRRLSARPFAPGITFEDIDDRMAAGATIEILDATGATGLLLAAVQPDGTVNLQPGSKLPDPDDLLIGLTNRQSTQQIQS
ncbi:MAG: cation:proton antiporter [Acidimicrobiia bacterium]|nr:cation:proton antiporter [Acidimicrobiia bacterium]